MHEITTASSSQLPAKELRHRILAFEEITKTYPQVPIPVTQYFSRGVYVREITIPQGVIATGLIHKHECLSIVLEGEMEVITEDGPQYIKAPMVFESPAGVKRAGRALTDCRWLTIHPYDGLPLDEKAMAELTHVDTFEELEQRPQDRDDYGQLLEEFGIDEELVRTMSDNESDYQEIEAYDMFEVRESPIQGVGVFALVPFPAGAIIGPARIGNMRTQLGRRVNHAAEPNAQHMFHPTADQVIQVALEPIRPGDEITNNYRRSFNMFRSLHGDETP